MKNKLYHPGWRIVFAIGFVAFISSYVFKKLNIEMPDYWTALMYVVGFSIAVFGVIQVLLSTIISKGEKLTWCISLLLLAPLALLLYFIVYKRIHGFYLHHSKI